MAITSAICTSFKKELALGQHDFTLTTGNTFKLALFLDTATLGAATTAYGASNETSGAGYSAGGSALTNVTPVNSGTKAIIDFEDLTLSNATFTARGCLIYNSTSSDKAVLVQDFGANKSPSASDFIIQFPVADGTTGLLRLA